MMKRGVIAFIVAAVFSGQVDAKPRTKEFPKPTYSDAYEPQGVDERGLWGEIDELELSFRDSPQVYRNEDLNNYIKGILCKTVGFERCSAARIYVVKDRQFNASMYPNGMMLVHTGLLARLHNEAELANVLAHEFSHFQLRHGVYGFRKYRSATDALAWISLLGAATNQNTNATQNAIVAGFFSYNRNQEKDADILSVAYVMSSPYPVQFSTIWQRMLDEESALREERGLRKIKRVLPGPTETHPTPLQRIAYLKVFEASEFAQDGDSAAEFYRAQTNKVLPELFDSLIKSNEFAGVDFIIRTRGDALGWDSLLLHTRAELYRLRGSPRDLVTAKAFFEKATQLPDAPVEAWRGLGLTSLRTGDSLTGRPALETYLQKAPNASDVKAIRLILEN